MQIEHSKLTKGQKVWYRYEHSQYPASGPFTVLDFYSDHEGRHVTLSEPPATGGVRNVCLASDDDYGQPIFYDQQPQTQ